VYNEEPTHHIWWG